MRDLPRRAGRSRPRARAASEYQHLANPLGSRHRLPIRCKPGITGGGLATKDRKLDVSTLEGWLWDAACQIRGSLDAPKYKDYILPLVFLKRLSDVFEDELDTLAEEFGDPAKALTLVEKDHGLVRFYVPEEARWSVISVSYTHLRAHETDSY